METRRNDYQYETRRPPSYTPDRKIGRETLDLSSMQLAQLKEEKEVSPVEQGLRQRIIGQDSAIESIVAALRLGEFRNPRRPKRNLLFLGPTGVGKSEMAKELAVLLSGDDNAFLKIDCSQYSQGHEVTALVGAPPSFVGREQHPIFDPYVIQQDNSVILFDEIEKGHQKLHDLMLQILDDGEVTLLNGGAKVSFRNSIIIATSNVGSHEISELVGGKKIGFTAQEEKTSVTQKQIDKAAFEALKRRFRPEFIGRFDDRIVFSPLEDNQLSQVLDQYVMELNNGPESVAAGVNLKLVPELMDRIVASSENREQLGARPVLRRFENTVWKEYAELVSYGSIPRDSQVYAVPADDDDASGRTAHFYYDQISMQSAIDHGAANGIALALQADDDPAFAKKIDYYNMFKSGK